MTLSANCHFRNWWDPDQQTEANLVKYVTRTVDAALLLLFYCLVAASDQHDVVHQQDQLNDR